MSERKPIITVKGLKTHFPVKGTKKVVRAVDGVDLVIYQGETLGVVGESGSGKSVSTTAIPGLLPANAQATGSIFFEGVDLMGLTLNQLREYRGKRIGLIFQEPGRSFDPLQSIGKVFWETFRNSQPDITREESDRKAVALLQEVELPDPEGRLKAYPHQFSGGQRQRIGIARALAPGPQLLILDEPVSALDVSVQSQVLNLLLELQKELTLSYLFISHDLSVVHHVSDRVAVMYLGKIVEMGDADQVYYDPRHAYTRALLSAIPLPDPHSEKNRQRITYNSLAAHDYTVDKPTLREIIPGHFVHCNDAEEAAYKKEFNL